MYKEIVICIIVIALIIIGNIITQNNTNKIVDEMTVSLTNLQEVILNRNINDNAEGNINIIESEEKNKNEEKAEDRTEDKNAKKNKNEGLEENLKGEIKIEVEEEIKLEMENIKKMWKEKYETLAYYIEHDELEKVETELTKSRANIETKEYAVAIENIESCNFILEHIKDKSSLKIVNLF